MTVSLPALTRTVVAGFLAPAACIVLGIMAWLYAAPAPDVTPAVAANGLHYVQAVAAVSMTLFAVFWLVCSLYLLVAGHRRALQAMRDPARLIPAARWLRQQLPAILITTTTALAATLASAAVWLAIALGVAGPLHGDMPMLHHAAVMACGGLALFAGVDLFRFVAGTRALRRTLAGQPVTQLPGQLLTASAAPALWQLVRDIAKAQDARVPDQIVLGFVEGAFVTAAPVQVQPAGTELQGCTLHLPLLTLAHLDEAECTALIAHELSHVANADIEQALTLAADQRAIGRGHAVLEHSSARAQLEGLLTRPVACIAESVMAALDRAVARDRRAAEYRADRAAADASSAQVAAATVLRAAATQNVAQQAIAAFQNGGITHPQRPFTAADAWLRANAMPAVAQDAAAADPHARHPGFNERLAALDVANDRRVYARAERIITPGQNALAGYIGPDAPVIEQVDRDLANLLTDDYARWLHTLVRDKQNTPTDNIYYADMRSVIAVCVVVGIACLLGGLFLFVSGYATHDLLLPAIVAPCVGVFSLGLAAWRLLGRPPAVVQVTDSAILSRALCDPIPIDAVDNVSFDRRNGQLSVYLQLHEQAPLPHCARITLGAAQCHASSQHVVLRFGPLRTSAERLTHERFVERFTAALQGRAAGSVLDELGAEGQQR
ncbi:M48 family metalloprotease [Salinisphaera sp. C84B14]|uniref:M48 family metalloprotease n=1 Tax=Salinisphaera sp. C84B14 TaxID=1304155 RepID=UPI0033405170